MKAWRLYKILLFLLVTMVAIKPTLRIAFHPIQLKYAHVHQAGSPIRPPSKYDFSIQRTHITAQTACLPQPLICIVNSGYMCRQPVLLGLITKRHLLNIHFRILPERKIFLHQGRLTV